MSQASLYSPVIISFLISGGIYTLSDYISKRISTSYLNLHSEAKADWNDRVLSTTSAFIALTGTLYCTQFDQCRFDPAFGVTYLCDWVSCWIIGYWTFDLIVTLRYTTRRINSHLT
eukprot:TRINITY_DN2291_c0_g1_i4.p1 TRINITY_DN2291_c0_g1~~TRINITY_DN2291_c0_g1_i4.p1  ORF type:complete len:116 (+),score=7.22 TRINITY_DN2291_c0_g1_i4:46-393(+)